MVELKQFSQTRIVVDHVSGIKTFKRTPVGFTAIANNGDEIGYPYDNIGTVRQMINRLNKAGWIAYATGALLGRTTMDELSEVG